MCKAFDLVYVSLYMSVYISIVCLSQVPVSLTLCLLGCAAVINGGFFSSLHFPNTLPLKGGISAKPRIYFIDLPENTESRDSFTDFIFRNLPNLTRTTSHLYIERQGVVLSINIAKEE